MARYDDRRGIDDLMDGVNAEISLTDKQRRKELRIDDETWNRAESQSESQSDWYFSDRWIRDDTFSNPVLSNRSTHAIDVESVTDIDRKVDKVIEDIWSTAEYENACREIDEHLSFIERIDIENSIDDELLDRYRSNRALYVSKTDTIGFETTNRYSEFRSQTEEALSASSLSIESDQAPIDQIENTELDVPGPSVPNCTFIRISDVFKVWRKIRSESEQQNAIASRFDIDSRMRMAIHRWSMAINVSEQQTTFESLKEQEKKERYHRTAERFRSLYLLQSSFRAWIKALEQQRETQRLNEMHMQEEMMKATTAARYRTLYLLRWTLVHWRNVASATAAFRKLDARKSLLHQKIAHRLQQGVTSQRSDIFKEEKISVDASCHASEHFPTAKSGILSTKCATSMEKPFSQCVASNDIHVDVCSDRAVSSSLPNNSPQNLSNEIRRNAKSDELHPVSPKTKTPHVVSSSTSGSIARWSPSVKRASITPCSILSIERKLVTKLSDLAVMHYHRSLQRSKWKQWRTVLNDREAQDQKGILFRKRRLQKSALLEWKLHMLPYKWKGIVREIDLYQKARAHNTKRFLLPVIKRWLDVASAERYRKISLKHQFLSCWAVYLRQANDRRQIAHRIGKTRQLQQVILLWKTSAKDKIALREEHESQMVLKALHHLHQLRIRRLFTAWLQLHRQERESQRTKNTFNRVMQWLQQHRANKRQSVASQS